MIFCGYCGGACRNTDPNAHTDWKWETATPHPVGGIDATLAERGSRYGVFADQAAIEQNLKDVMRKTANWDRLAPDQKSALEMECSKNARILNGDPNFHDSWHDKFGYNKLVADRILVLQK